MTDHGEFDPCGLPVTRPVQIATWRRRRDLADTHAVVLDVNDVVSCPTHNAYASYVAYTIEILAKGLYEEAVSIHKQYAHRVPIYDCEVIFGFKFKHRALATLVLKTVDLWERRPLSAAASHHWMWGQGGAGAGKDTDVYQMTPAHAAIWRNTIVNLT